MKKYLTTLALFIGFFANAQLLGYGDFGVLLSGENNSQNTARFTAMKGAYGSLGGNLSAMAVNPAGAAVYTYSTASFTLGYNQLDLFSEFYGNKIKNSEDNFNLSQIGGLLLFDVDSNASLQKIAVGLNYNLVNDFENAWIAKGVGPNSGIEDPADSNIVYTNVDSQEYKNFTSGKHTKFNISVAAQYDDFLYMGASVNTYDVKFTEDSTRQELANDGNGNTVDAFESYWQEVKGDGFSFGLGLIFKITQSLRLGLSYHSPVWYDIHEENNFFEENDEDQIGYYSFLYSNDPTTYQNNKSKVQAYDYTLRTPGTLTGSLSFVFNKSGLISVDILRKNYKGIKLGPNTSFSKENQDIDKFLDDTFTINLGTEWRIGKLSIRGGYSYEKSPYRNAIKTDNLRSYSLGAGFDFGMFNIDVAYDHGKQTDIYDFYPEFNDINAAELTKNNDKILVSLSIKL